MKKNCDDRKQIWVDTDFSKILKMKAAEKGSNVLQLTREMSKEEDPFSEFKKGGGKKKYDFF